MRIPIRVRRFPHLVWQVVERHRVFGRGLALRPTELPSAFRLPKGVVMPYSRSLSWKAWLAYWLPRSE